MGASPKQAFAEGRMGCLICDAWGGEVISLVEHDALVCRPCSVTIGRAVVGMSPSMVARLWPGRPGGGADAHQSPGGVDLEEVSAALRARVESMVTADDAQAHFDLALAYGEMGLMGDAVGEAATALGRPHISANLRL